jgi:hypothetical protein
MSSEEIKKQSMLFSELDKNFPMPPPVW